MAALAATVWRQPKLEESVLTAYRPTAAGARSQYSLTITLNWRLAGLCGPLFEKLRSALLGLDPTITEEVLKLYIAYKAETNVVDVVPLAFGCGCRSICRFLS